MPESNFWERAPRPLGEPLGKAEVLEHEGRLVMLADEALNAIAHFEEARDNDNEPGHVKFKALTNFFNIMSTLQIIPHPTDLQKILSYEAFRHSFASLVKRIRRSNILAAAEKYIQERSASSEPSVQGEAEILAGLVDAVRAGLLRADIYLEGSQN